MTSTMKSFLKFLSHNKVYTLIDVFGLAVSFMFLIIIGAYTWQENHLDVQHSKLHRMYALGFDMRGEKLTGSHWQIINRIAGRFPEIESGAALLRADITMLTAEGEPMATSVLFADSTFYDIFDFKLEQGDARTALDAPNAAVVTREYARKIWGEDDPIGKSVVWSNGEENWSHGTSGTSFIVSAVMEPMANTMLLPKSGKPIDIILPFASCKYYNEYLTNENMGNATGAEVVLLAKEGYDLHSNQQAYHDFAKEFFWILQLPEADIKQVTLPLADLYFSEYPSSNGTFEHGNRKLVNMLFLFGVVILLFALMNYVNLTVALSGYRAKEMATRRLLGESRAGIMAKLIGESLMLCVVSFAIGALLAWLALPYAENLLETKIYVTSCITPVTIAVALGVILLMGLLAGIVPAWLISSAKPIDVVRGSYRRRTKMVFSKVFIVVQNIITIVMVATAITMYLQVDHLINAPLGYDTDDVMYIEAYANPKAFMERVEQLSGVEAISACQGHPLQGGNNNTGVYDVNGEKRTLSFQILVGDENYMDVLGLGLDRDNHNGASNKLYVNHQALSELGLTEDAMSIPNFVESETISGILTDFKIRGILADQHPLKLYIIPNLASSGRGIWGYLIKVSGDKDEVARQVKEIYNDLYHIEYENPELYLMDTIKAKYRQEKNLQSIVAIFAVIALIISLLGLVAMSTYFVQQRQREIAVKKVFGCESTEMLCRLVFMFLAYIGIAFVIAVPLIYYLMHSWLSTFAYRIPLHWWIYAVAGLLCAVVSTIAVFVQSYRAANRNPIITLYQNQ